MSIKYRLSFNNDNINIYLKGFSFDLTVDETKDVSSTTGLTIMASLSN